MLSHPTDRSSPNKQGAQEEGVILVLAAIVLTSLLLLIGFVVDLGRLYHARLELQKAADAGALAGMQSASIQSDLLTGKTADQKKAHMESRAREVTRANMVMNGISRFDPARDIVVQYIDSEDPKVALARMNVSAQAQIPFLLMNRLPPGMFGLTESNDTIMLGATASTVRPVANIVLILDISKSMNCPASKDDDCVCLTPKRTQTCEEIGATPGPGGGPAPGLKIELLKAAVKEFVGRFNEKFDRISIVPFNIAADSSTNDEANGVTDKKGVRFLPYEGQVSAPEYGFNKKDVERAIDNLKPASNTNLSDGLLKAYVEAKRVGLVGSGQEISYVVFSDGAPTAARFLFTGETTTGLPKTNNPDGLGDYDYTFYTIYWSLPSPEDPSESITYPGPSPLVLSQFVPMDYDLPEPPKDSSGHTAVPPCASATLEKNPLNYKNVMSGCLKNFQAHLPEDPQSKFGKNFEPVSYSPAEGTAGQIKLRVWEEVLYAVTLQYADFLRLRGGVFYVAGLGKELKITGDPYQIENAIDATVPQSASNLLRKDVMLSRLANAPDKANIGKPDAHPQFNFDGYHTYEELQDNPATKTGEYEFGYAATDLSDIFDKLASDLLLRLVR